MRNRVNQMISEPFMSESIDLRKRNQTRLLLSQVRYADVHVLYSIDVGVQH